MNRRDGLAPISYAHLSALSDRHGIFEHARGRLPRRDGGYCVDDVSRALIVVVRDTEQLPPLPALGEVYLAFLEDAIGAGGAVRNRMSVFGTWTDEPSFGDWWGRLLWALGVAVAHTTDPVVRTRALTAFHRAAVGRSTNLRSMCFATLGAAEVLATYPDDAAARSLAVAGIAAVPVSTDPDWLWPEARLAYGNASIAEALMSAGHALGDDEAEQRGLSLLSFLLELESAPGHLSVTGSSGRGPGDASPQFDQQSIEVAALADACARAWDLAGDASWLDGIQLAWRWFDGENDSATPMWDLDRGAGFDGLEPGGRNENQGAESTLAALSTLQQTRRLVASRNSVGAR